MCIAQWDIQTERAVILAIITIFTQYLAYCLAYISLTDEVINTIEAAPYFNASAAVPSRSSDIAIFSCKSVSMRLRNWQHDYVSVIGVVIWAKIWLSSFGQRSGCRDSASDWTILFPGVCTSFISNSERYKDHRACRRFSFFASW